MIAFVRGVLFEKKPTEALIDVHGVGYKVMISLNTYDRLPACGVECRLHTYLIIREDEHILHGFYDSNEKETFELLITVNGIGPKVALSILNGLSVSDLRVAIADGNVKRLSSVHGVGKKTAERLIVELRDKIDPAEAFAARVAGDGVGDTAILRDTVMALTQLGYQQEQARKMVQKVLDAGGDTSNTEVLLKRALAGK
ncbi:MAG: Holliday junction branch migration protein RuvA [Lentisphaerae bacterium]|nr:Holliday junction branch migration protein RuvA [Lentisphaerota bacterium]